MTSPIMIGSAALALAHSCRPFHSVLCHERAHIETDECGAPEFFSGGSKLHLITGANGKLDLMHAADVLAHHIDVHSSKPRVLSLTQATELGTVYTPDELDAVSAFAKKHELALHMPRQQRPPGAIRSGFRPRGSAQSKNDRLLPNFFASGKGQAPAVIAFTR